MKQFVSPDDLQQAVDVFTKGIALSRSPEKKYTAQDMIEFGLTCVATLPKADVGELGANAAMFALVAYEEAKETLGGHS